MFILGICDSQDSGAALVDEQNNCTAINEERLTRKKLTGGFPANSIKKVLQVKGIAPDAIKEVALASSMTPSFFFRKFRKYHQEVRSQNKQFSLQLATYAAYQIIVRKFSLLRKVEEFFSKRILRNELRQIGIDAPLRIVEHHQGHAYAAYATSGFDQALVLTIDGLGDGLSFTVSKTINGKVNRIFAQNAFNDITLYYSRLTEFLGFIPIQDEGKVMGLAAYSDNYAALEIAQKLLAVDKGRFRYRNLILSLNRDKKIFKSLRGLDKKDIAASFQMHLERCIVKIVRYWIKQTGIKNIALCGGFFANIKVNQKICQMDEVARLYVYPHMGDGGLALGAACAVKNTKPFTFSNVFLGPSFSKGQMEELLKEQAIRYKVMENTPQYLAGLLSKGKIIARFQGAMEYGPRALGNRSILSAATNPQIQKQLNLKLGRDEFMPFAPAILIEDARKCCLGTEKAEYSAGFMNVGFESTDYFRKICLAVVHKDKSTRPQFVSKDNKQFYALLDKYKKLTGIPALINTSFNVHEEPIVCDVLDALAAFKKAGLDYLAIDDFLIER